jgi:hypothetical protein
MTEEKVLYDSGTGLKITDERIRIGPESFDWASVKNARITTSRTYDRLTAAGVFLIAASFFIFILMAMMYSVASSDSGQSLTELTPWGYAPVIGFLIGVFLTVIPQVMKHTTAKKTLSLTEFSGKTTVLSETLKVPQMTQAAAIINQNVGLRIAMNSDMPAIYRKAHFKSMFTTMLLAILPSTISIWGLGHLYLGKTVYGLLWLGASLIIWFVIPNGPYSALSALVLSIMHIVHAHYCAKKMGV